jgi:DNA ligase (NAD+)
MPSTLRGWATRRPPLLVDTGLVRELADLFDLTVEALLPLPLFGEKKAENLVRGIQARRRTELARFLNGLGIPEVGVFRGPGSGPALPVAGGPAGGGC